MLKREQIANLVNTDLTFLDDQWDAAIIGYAERGGPGRHILPCYGHQVMKVLLRDRGLNPKELFTRLQILRNSMRGDKPLILTKYSRQKLWKAIREANYPVWDLLDQAVIGLGSLGWEPTGVVYNKPLCSNIIQASQSASQRGEIFDAASAIGLLESSIISVDLGQHSPWFVTPV